MSKTEYSRTCDFILTPIYISVTHRWLENTYLDVILCVPLDFPLLTMLFSAPHMIESPCYFPTAITLHTSCVSSIFILQMKDLFKIYPSMYDMTIFVWKINAQSKLEKILSTFYYQFFRQLDPPWTAMIRKWCHYDAGT